ncbi:MAG: hypothetical protein IT327_07790 [Anaerolineae bacterium]|nr:hypothetical protein [Anaerolineae bacterium]
MIDVLDLAKREEALDDGGYAFYVVDPDQMYPAMIDHATAVIEANDMSLVPRDQRGYVATLRQLGNLSAAAVHVDSAVDLDTREKILETLRLWFTRLLKAATGEASLGLKITSDDPAVLAFWRLRPKA